MNITIITEGTAETGYGHLTRCLSIYQGFEERGLSPNFIANCDANGKNVLKDISVVAFDWVKNSVQLINHIRGSDIAIIDSYLAELPLYEESWHSVDKMVYFDDTLRLDYPPGIIVNGAVNAERLPYKASEIHTFLLGLEYTPMRKAFWDISDRIPRENIKNVLITIGGYDDDGLTFQILDAVRKSFPKMNCHVVLGYGSHLGSRTDHWKDTSFYQALSASEIRDLMLKCDLAISAAGQTTYELIRTATPSIFIQTAENQKNNIQGWYEKGVIREIISSEHANYIAKVIDALKGSEVRNLKFFHESNSTLNIIDKVLDAYA